MSKPDFQAHRDLRKSTYSGVGTCKSRCYGGISMKWLNVIGLGLSFVGSIMTGLIAQRGIPKKGQLIKAPRLKVSVCGWILIALGFLVSLVAAAFE